jgi:SAM-dependent methyltransferase
MKKNYEKIKKHYEDCLEKYGDNNLGVDWPKIEDVATRYVVMLELLNHNKKKDGDVTLLDFGCGTAHLLEFISNNEYNNIVYSGLDISQKFIDVASKKFPNSIFFCEDILEESNKIPNFDFIVMNGVFTEKRELTFDEMWDFFVKLISVIFNKCNLGFAFNIMSKNVDWEREDLFHVPLDLLSKYLCDNITRNFIIRNDYGLYEYTVYVLKK